MAFVEAADVERGRHGNFGAEFRKTLGEFEARLTHIYGAVDMGLRNIEELGRALDFRHAHDDGHGHARGGSEVAGEQGAIVDGETHVLSDASPTKASARVPTRHAESVRHDGSTGQLYRRCASAVKASRRRSRRRMKVWISSFEKTKPSSVGL